jgi:hypothetical protein
MRKKYAGFVLLVALCIGCGGSSATPVQVTDPTPIPHSIQISVSDSTLWVGQSVSAKSEVADQFGRVMDAKVGEWRAETPAILQVTVEGVVKALGVGDGRLSFSARNIISYISLRVIAVPTQAISILPKQADRYTQQKIQLISVARDSVGAPLSTKTLVWKSSDARIATVDDNGNATAIGPGVATITVQADGVTDSMTLVVKSRLNLTLGGPATTYHNSKLIWSAMPGSSCIADGEWTGSRSASGSEEVVPLKSGEVRYGMSCVGSDGISVRQDVLLNLPPAIDFPETCTGSTGDVIRDNRFVGNYVVQNGKWGIETDSLLSPGRRMQCVSGSLVDNFIETNWRWDFDPAHAGVMSYPNITAGYFALETSPTEQWWWSTTPDLPKLAVDAKEMSIQFTEILGADRDEAFNTMIEFNFYKNSIPRPSELVLEISINVVAFRPAPVQDEIVASGIAFTVHKGIGSTQLIFDAKTALFSGSLKFADFIDYAVRQGYLRSTDFLANVQIGNEIWGGKGSAFLRARLNR